MTTRPITTGRAARSGRAGGQRVSARWTTRGHPLNDTRVIRALWTTVDNVARLHERSTLGDIGLSTIHSPYYCY